MKKFLISICMVILVFGFANGSGAYSNSGEWMFTLEGNDSNYGISLLETEIENWFLNEKVVVREIDLEFYSKLDAPGTSNGFMTITYESDNMSGTWSATEAIEFYSVKGAKEFAFYWVNGGNTTGTWSTEDLLTNSGNIPEISHLSTWNPVDPGTNPVPEPATMFLLGSGLVGAGIFRRKRNK